MKTRSFYLVLALMVPTSLCSKAILEKKERIIEIHNKITNNMLGYRKLGMTYHPSKFTCKAHNTPIALDTKHTLSVTDNTLTVCYDYSFLAGTHKGSKEITFALNPEAKEHELTFSWSDPSRLKLSGAEVKEIKRVY